MSRRVALMTNCVGRAGAEVQLVRLAVRLQRMGDEVAVISMLPFLDHEETLRRAGIRTACLVPDIPMWTGRPIPKSVGIRAIGPGVRVLRAGNFDALICFVHEASLFGRLVGRLARVPVIIGSERNEWLEGPLGLLATRLSDPLVTATTTNSSIVAESYLSKGVVPASKLEVIPNGIQIEEYQPTAERSESRAGLGVAEHDFLWLAVGRLRPQKDYPTLLEAFAALIRAGELAQLRIAGGGPQLAALQQLAATLGIEDRVAFLGLRDDIPDLLSAADGFVMASGAEGLSNAVMEACAAGLPVVATRAGGMAELVKDGQTGYLVPKGDAQALSAAMAQLASTPEEQRHKMGALARENVRAYCGMDEVARTWSDLIDRHLVRVRA